MPATTRSRRRVLPSARSSRGPEGVQDRPLSAAEAALRRIESGRHSWSWPRARLWVVVAVVFGFYAASWYLAKVDLGKLATGIPKIGYWLAQAWPPKLDELPLFLLRTGETVAMAALGTTMAVLLAIPMAVLGSRNITPFPRLYHPVRWVLIALRGVVSFVFLLVVVG